MKKLLYPILACLLFFLSVELKAKEFKKAIKSKQNTAVVTNKQKENIDTEQSILSHNVSCTVVATYSYQDAQGFTNTTQIVSTADTCAEAGQMIDALVTIANFMGFRFSPM
jgi:hypothetical protein